MPGYRAIPPALDDQIQSCSSETFFVAATKRLRISDIESGALDHLGVMSANPASRFSVVPPVEQGRWSAYNVNGWEKIRRDLPKVEKAISTWETPIYGDPSRGYHTHQNIREVYQREILYGKSRAVEVDIVSAADGYVTAALRVDQVFDRRELDRSDLHLAASLARENLGAEARILPADMSVSEWLKTQQVDWEFLPPGELTLERITRLVAANAPAERQQMMLERVSVIQSLEPGEVVIGTSRLERYIGFKFEDDLVVLENFNYGNALYVMYENWDELSRRSRASLRSDSTAAVDRIVHAGRWKARLQAILHHHRTRLGPSGCSRG